MAVEGFTLTILAHGADNPNDAPVPYAVGVTNDEQPTLPSGMQWHIRASGYEATIVEVGGGLRALRHDGEDIVHGYAEDTMADAARGHVLAPWPNRIAGGRYAFDGDTYLLPLTEPEHANAAHGLVRWQPWQLVEHATHRVTVGVTLHPQPGWAWTVRFEMTYVLGPDGLTITPRATNLSDTPCPFGFGMHPYLTAGESSLDDVTLTAPLDEALTVDERLIPVGREPASIDFTESASLRGVTLDTCFTGIGARPGSGMPSRPADAAPRADGAAASSNDAARWEVSVSTSSRVTTLWADAREFGYLQLFTGDGLPEPKNRRSGLAVEPMTCPANAFNTGEGLMVLHPGRTWTASFGISSRH